MGFVLPDKFIKCAEQTGLIIYIDQWVVERACWDLSNLISRGAPEKFKLHINISALQLKAPDFFTHLLDCIERHKLTTENICLELTEYVLIDDMEKTKQVLAELRNHKINIALDDFGSGYSSL